jgi:glycosyltransferase involved in cell wall biosynthesis
MNIIIITSCNSWATANYLIHAFKQTENKVFVYSDTLCEYSKIFGNLVDYIGKGVVEVEKIIAVCPFSPDLVLFIEGGTMRVFPLGLEKLDCLTAWYAIDTHMDYEKHLRISRVFDVTFVCQKEYVEKFKEDGIKQVFWLPLAAASELYSRHNHKRIYDIAYIGGMGKLHNKTRYELLESIKQNFPSVFFGMALPNEMAQIYQKARIVFNKSINNDVNMRYFEAMAAGALLVTDHTINNGAEDLFEPGKDFVEYYDEHSLLEELKRFLGNEPLRSDISERAKRKVLANHTYRHRVKQLISEISNCKKLDPPLKDLYFSIFYAMRLRKGLLRILIDLAKTFVLSKCKRLR